ncbi:MAG: biotin--[acetyl-CoA-carboxylase] ligase [Phycisphaerae bacterium]|nr:biotin--[acetyl-CoA-carboxylase] ligase [Phycisphaerae bacterium]MDD5380882.1 biotin--[acetyl-CoA-carboxylase] ligase [Phycisphaerae bacterium]
MSPAHEHLDPDKIKVNTKRIGRKILVYNHTSSTNDIAAEYAKNKDNDGLAIFAEEQTAGRGRTGAKWLSRRCDSILCSILLTSCKCNPEMLSLACPVAVAEAVGKIAHSHAKIKWPNDIILNGKKVAGIMVESKKVNGSTAYIIGIGINCHQKKNLFPDELQTTATSIDIEGRLVCDRISLARRLLSSLDHWLEAAEDTGKKIIDRWRKLNTLLNQRITVIYNGRKFTGNCIGVDPEKGLIVQLDRGGVRMFHAAQTTIAK